MEKSELSKGLLLLIETNPYAQSIATCIGFPYGSIDESINGEAHFLEHMLFKGTEKRGWKEIKKPLTDTGGNINASTDFEETLYFTKVHKEDFGLSLDILSDMIQNSAFPEEELEKEKSVIRSEQLITLDNPRWLAHRNFPSVLYEDHPAKNPVVGTGESIKKIQRKDLVQEWKKNYTPKSMIVGISGNIKKREAQRNVEEAFEKFNRKFNGKGRKLAKESQKKKEVHLENKGIKQSQLVMGYKIGNFRDEQEYWAFLIIKQILYENVFNSIREEKGLSYDPYADCRRFNTFGYLSVSLSLKEKDVQLAKQLIKNEFMKLWEGDIKPKEVEKKKNLIRKSHLLFSEQTSYAAMKMVRFYLNSGNPYLYNNFPKKIEQVSFEDVTKVAENYLNPEKYGLLHLKPKI